MNIQDILKRIDYLTEEAVEEEVLQDTPEQEPEVAPAFNDGMSLADTLDTKAKIARCLEALKDAIEDFKEATAEKIDLLQDELVLKGIEDLDVAVNGIEAALAAGSNILGDSELNDAFRTELPSTEDEVENVETTEEETAEDEDADVEEYDFEDQASLDLFANS